MGTIADLNEIATLAALATGDLMLVRDISDAADKDKKMQVGKLAWKDSATITANRVAAWKDANTLMDAGFLYTDVARKGTSLAAQVYHSTTQSIPNSVETVVAFNSERFDNGGLHDNTTNNSRFTIPITGTYLFTANIAFDNNATGVREVALRASGSAYLAYQSQNTVPPPRAHKVNIACIVSLVAGFYVEVTVTQTSGIALNILSLSNYSPDFSIALLDNK